MKKKHYAALATRSVLSENTVGRALGDLVNRFESVVDIFDQDAAIETQWVAKREEMVVGKELKVGHLYCWPEGCWNLARTDANLLYIWNDQVAIMAIDTDRQVIQKLNCRIGGTGIDINPISGLLAITSGG